MQSSRIAAAPRPSWGGTPGVTVSSLGTGYVGVTFPTNVSACTWIATQGTNSNNDVGADFATVRGDGNADDVGVVTWSLAGDQTDEDFDLVVIC